MKFIKMQGAGNDFVFPTEKYIFTKEQISEICHRRFGVGADGLVIVEKANNQDYDFTIDFFNSDGSNAFMCGNASRCAVFFAKEKGIINKKTGKFKTKSGLYSYEIIENQVKINMGKPKVKPEEIPVIIKSNDIINTKVTVLNREFEIFMVNTGVPHLVTFTEELSEEDIVKYGEILETLDIFPENTNVNFATKTDFGLIVNTFERGAGRTYACGTGASACGYIVNKLDGANSINILMKGGNVIIDVVDGEIFMTGKGEVVFEGTINIK